MDILPHPQRDTKLCQVVRQLAIGTGIHLVEKGGDRTFKIASVQDNLMRVAYIARHTYRAERGAVVSNLSLRDPLRPDQITSKLRGPATQWRHSRLLHTAAPA